MKLSLVNFILAVFILFFINSAAFSQVEPLRMQISEIVRHAEGHVGVAIMNLESGDTLTVNDDYCYPMQSVYKFPLALAVLSEVDKGSLALDQKVRLTKENLHPNTWSPLRKKYPDGNADVMLSEIIKYTISVSDNNGCDILFNLIGGPSKVNQYIHNLGIKNMSIVATEEEMHKDWAVQYKNCSTPSAMVKLLNKFYSDSILSAASKDFLWNVMSMNVFVSKRISGELPAGTVVAHKTGTSDVNDDGIAAATNDAGIVILPNGNHLAIAVFVSDSPENSGTRDKVIADISRAAWDYFTSD